MRTSRFSALFRLSAALAVALVLLAPPRLAQAADQTWRGEYFANQDLAGTPALVRSDNDVNFNWGWGSPAPGIPVDHFTVRWTRTVALAGGQWRFNAEVDDGIRLAVDGQTIIDQWRITAPITYTTDVALAAGEHTLRVEYWENTERAQIRVWWQQVGAAQPGAVAPANAGAWHGVYFDNQNLADDPAFERDDANIYFHWGYGGPGGGVGNDEFSVRWTRRVSIPGGTYRFKVKADDGVRVWLDWRNLINEWHASADKTYTREVDVSNGMHTLVVEYYEAYGLASIEFSYENANVDWVGTLSSCMPPTKSWLKVYRLAPDNTWEDLKPSGYGPTAANGEFKLFGVPVDATYGWDGQPYMVELWTEGRLVRSEGNIFAGQPALRVMPGQDVRTSWPCG